MGTLTRYVLLQVPGWMLAALILMGLWQWMGLSSWVTIGLFLLLVVKDFIFYPFVRTAYSGAKTGTEQLIGVPGIAQGQLDPRGYVRIGAELWRAEAEPSHKPILPGSSIRVRAAHGLTLVVTTDKDNKSNAVLP